MNILFVGLCLHLWGLDMWRIGVSKEVLNKKYKNTPEHILIPEIWISATQEKFLNQIVVSSCLWPLSVKRFSGLHKAYKKVSELPQSGFSHNLSKRSSNVSAYLSFRLVLSLLLLQRAESTSTPVQEHRKICNSVFKMTIIRSGWFETKLVCSVHTWFKSQ